MPVCTICQADGVVCINDAWYCPNHIDQAFFELGRQAARILDWDEGETVDQLREWYESDE